MFSTYLKLIIGLCSCIPFGAGGTAFGFQQPASAVNNSNPPDPGSTPVTTFIDPSSGQMYGRYIVNETIPVATYEFQPVKEKVYVPKTVTENKSTTQIQYVPIYSYQPRMRNIYAWNPFASPQQVWEYVPTVQYQTKYVQVNQPFTYVRYEEQERELMVPELKTKTQQVPRYVDRPMAGVPNVPNGQSPNNALNSPIANTNIYQDAATAAMANRNIPNYPTRPMDNPWGVRGAQPSFVAQAPQPYYVSNAPRYYAANPTMLAAATAPNRLPPMGTAPNSYVIPSVPVMTNNPNAMASNVATYPPYANVAARPSFTWPSIASSTGSLFKSSIFSNGSNPNYVASNTQVGQPYLWGNNTAGGFGFRPNSSPYVPQPQNWGVTPANNYRDPIQGGMPPTVLR